MAYNNPTAQYRSYYYYNTILSEGFDDIVDVESFQSWAYNIDSLFYYENRINSVTGRHEEFYEDVVF